MDKRRHINAQFELPAVSRRELKKPLQAVFARHNLPRREQQVLDAMIYFSYTRLPEQRKFEIPTTAFRELIGYRRNELSHLKTAAHALYERSIEWGTVEGDSPWRGLRFVADVEVDSQSVIFEFPESMASAIAHAVQCATLDPARIRALKTQYGKRLYEIGRWFLPEGTTGYSAIENWRDFFLNGSPKYSEFKDFNRNVIRIAIDDVNQNTELSVTAEYLGGRPRTHLQFKVDTDPQEEAKIGAEVRGTGIPAMIELGIIDDPNTGDPPSAAATSSTTVDPEIDQIKTAFRSEFGLGSVKLGEYDALSKARWTTALEDVRNYRKSGGKPYRSWAAYAIGILNRHLQERDEPVASVSAAAPDISPEPAVTQPAKTPYDDLPTDRQEEIHQQFRREREKLLAGLRLSYPQEAEEYVEAEFRRWLTERGLA